MSALIPTRYSQGAKWNKVEFLAPRVIAEAQAVSSPIAKDRRADGEVLMAQHRLPGPSDDPTPIPLPQRVSEDRFARPDLQEAFAVIGQRKWSIALITLIVVGIALFVSSEQVPIYESETEVLVRSVDLDPGSANVAPPNLATEERLAASVAVAEVAADIQVSDDSPEDLLAGLSVDFPSDTEILTLSYRHPEPVIAQERAQTFAEAYLEYRRRTLTEALSSSAEALEEEVRALRTRKEALEAQLARLDEDSPLAASTESELALVQGLLLQRQLDQLSLQGSVNVGSIVKPAALPSSPVSPNHVLNAGFALGAGLGLGIGLAFLRDRFSGRLRTVPEVESLAGTHVLATIPQIPTWNKRKIPLLVARTEWQSPAAEAYRVLRTNLQSVVTSQGLRSILITSPRAGEGKSSTLANLGFVLAAAGKRVILVSADLRRPRLHEFFDLAPDTGLTDVLLGRAGPDDALFPVTSPASSTETLKVLPSGSATENPAELLSKNAMNDLLRDLEQRADLVLIDAPPLLPVSDALVLAPIVSGVLLVIGPGSTTSSAVLSSRQQLNKVAVRSLGIVLNGHDAAMGAAYYGYG